MTFEKKLDNSKEILEKLMNPEITLDESVKLYEKGLASIKEAQSNVHKFYSLFQSHSYLLKR